MVNKLAVILLAVAVYVGLEMTNVYVPDDFERPFYYKAMIAAFQIYGRCVRMIPD
jgi:hypothetical protein